VWPRQEAAPLTFKANKEKTVSRPLKTLFVLLSFDLGCLEHDLMKH
jgi:hypothetical protein